MRCLVTIFFILMITGCKPGNGTKIKTETKALPTTTFIDISFYPAFNSSSRLIIAKTYDKGYITCSVTANETSEKKNLFDSVQLEKSDFDSFFNALDTVSLLKISDDITSPGVDGITIEVSIIQYNHSNKFKTWSPRRKDKPSDYFFLDAVFGLVNRKLPGESDYFKTIKSYLDY